MEYSISYWGLKSKIGQKVSHQLIITSTSIIWPLVSQPKLIVCLPPGLDGQSSTVYGQKYPNNFKNTLIFSLPQTNNVVIREPVQLLLH